MPFTPEREDQFNKAMLDVIATSLENGLLHQSDLSAIAHFWESKADGIKTEEDLLSYLSALAQKWRIFMPLYEREERVIKLNRRLQQASPEVKKRFIENLLKGK